ncbi:CDP-alcohol phosphatidyltransferase family protein [Actinoplanes oblitus]|uniref:CDP-alcohol phosphatidyltransferase family protein n=1 Tax=Actinoplanes oblitus TaxID=3040509 RepID=A0ABY8WA09_9ACTN|nr:CDP-alcohol phosphatidyltransferase family protein [Actinoplanes oblitus]WIM94202.1 CDP-alcohol phosphatidyltransferase family protein [Actinoplanes oblitus]
MAQRPTLAAIRERTYKARDAWWTVWLVDPLASRLVWLVAPWRWVTPNRLTAAAFVVGLGSAAAFWHQGYAWLLLGALLFHVSFVLDCMDGKIARLNGTGSLFGTWLDYVFDRLRVLACAIGLFGGEFQRTDNVAYLWLGLLVIFLDMFRYLNNLQMQKVKGEMRKQLAAATPAPAVPVPAGPEPDAEDADDLQGDFRQQFGRFAALRRFLVANRIRPHLFSGIEFMMFVFIVGPVTNQLTVVTLASAVFMLAFELLLIYKLWANTKSFASRLAKVSAVAV